MSIPLVLAGARVSVPELLVSVPARSIALVAAELLASVKVAEPVVVIAAPETIDTPAAKP